MATDVAPISGTWAEAPPDTKVRRKFCTFTRCSTVPLKPSRAISASGSGRSPGKSATLAGGGVRLAYQPPPCTETSRTQVR
ncbi:hypothetical protein B7C42_08343 [Nocardia cerradoensis]|uniref:Uncharacterized protein n=1 Tax=Nocardia cerradoensis TaxID=85688 RepID=A0A231GSI4_9NOCA|nr:hypothetical protein B7C42_08343 [Nocardia cerradoensis]